MIRRFRIILFTVALATGVGMSVGAAAAALVQLSADASLSGLASDAQAPHAAGSIRFGVFNSLSDAALDAFDAGGSVTTTDVSTILADFFSIGSSITDFTPFGADAAGLLTGVVDLADSNDAPVPPGGITFADYQANFAGQKIYAVVEAGGQFGVYTSDTLFPTALEDILFSDFAATFGFTSFQPGFLPLIGDIEAVIVGSGVDNQAAGGFNTPNDGIGGFGSGEVVTTVGIVDELVIPPLGITKLGANVEVTWPISFTGWTLQQSTDLVAWSDVPGAPAMSATEFIMNMPIIPTQRYFRLRD